MSRAKRLAISSTILLILATLGSGCANQDSLGRYMAENLSSIILSEAAKTRAFKLAFITNSQTVPLNQCSLAVTIQSQNNKNEPQSAFLPLEVDLSGTGLVFFQNSGCTQPIVSTTIPAGTDMAVFYFIASAAGKASVIVSATGYLSGNQIEVITP